MLFVDYMGGSFPSKPDMQLKRLQSTVNAAAAPILNLWAELEEQELTTAQGGLVPVEVVLECFQKTLVLLGNASNYMSLNCRDAIIRKISQKSKGLGRLLNSACKESKPEDSLLFGPAVQKTITERAETMAALSKTAFKTDSGGDHKKFFRGGPTSGYGSGAGKNSRLYNKSNQNFSPKSRVTADLSPTINKQELSIDKQELSIEASITQTPQIPSALPVGGRLQHFVNNWSKITQDPWILQVISGCHIDFIETPPLTGPPLSPPPLSTDQMTVLSTEIIELETKEAIHHLPPNSTTLGFHSNLFAVPKKGGGGGDQS